MGVRIALPNGRLFPSALAAFRRFDSGTKLPAHRSYRMYPSLPGVDARIVKTRAIPQLVALGMFDAGYCGTDLVVEQGVEHLVSLAVDLREDQVQIVAGAARADILTNPPKRPLVIASEYPRLASEWAHAKGLAHIVLQTYGSTEGYVPDLADVAVDCLATGETMQANGLVVVDRIRDSSTHLIVNASRASAVRSLIEAAARTSNARRLIP